MSEIEFVCLSVLTTSRRNYRTNLHENCVKDVSLDEEDNINFERHPRLNHRDPKTGKTSAVEPLRVRLFTCSAPATLNGLQLSGLYC